MKDHRIKKWSAALLAGVLCLAALGGCASEKNTDEHVDRSSDSPSVSQETPQDASLYQFPTLGMNIRLPESLLEKTDQEEVVLQMDEQATDDGSALRYAWFSWKLAQQGQQSSEDGSQKDDNLQPIGVLGVYQADMEGQLDELTHCDTHKELGKSADGTYRYYRSTNSAADQSLIDEIEQIQIEITPMDDYRKTDSNDGQQSGAASVGSFTTQDINGETVTQDIFKEYELTLVNIFATWCSPCVAEMPDLEKLHQQMADRGVNVIGIVLDVVNEKGEAVQEDLERAQQLVEKTGVTYPVLVPDATELNGRLSNIQAVPETFFVDKNGNIVGETYSGSASLEDWVETVKKELAALKEGA